MDFDAIVIGSGFGGAVSACRLAEAGYRVLVLERGRRWDARDLSAQARRPVVVEQRAPERWNGWLDLRVFPHMAVAQGAARRRRLADLRQHLGGARQAAVRRRAGRRRSPRTRLAPHYDDRRAES